VKLRVLALALDGTIAVEGRLDRDVANALREARRAGIMTVLVSGRILPDIELLLPSRDLFDAIVAESGAVVQMANGASLRCPRAARMRRWSPSSIGATWPTAGASAWSKWMPRRPPTS
jgi:hydroxymethylpyrimidine pyrophosphatase-like HAD family hydrolase